VLRLLFSTEIRKFGAVVALSAVAVTLKRTLREGIWKSGAGNFVLLDGVVCKLRATGEASLLAASGGKPSGRQKSDRALGGG